MTDNKNITALDNLYNKISNDTAFLTKVNHGELSALFHVKRLLELQDAEIERLEKELDTETNHNERLYKKIDMLVAGAYYINKIKAEAIKEFAERICEGRVANDPVVIAIKCELKEMVGD